jgi:hypothetical protein
MTTVPSISAALSAVAHGVDGGLVGGLLVAAAHQRRGGNRGGFGDAHRFQRENAVECLAARHRGS